MVVGFVSPSRNKIGQLGSMRSARQWLGFFDNQVRGNHEVHPYLVEEMHPYLGESLLTPVPVEISILALSIMS